MKIQIVIVVLLLLNVMNSFACQNHDGPNFGVFGQFHPLAQQPNFSPKVIKLNMLNSKPLNVKTGDDEQVQLSYLVPIEYSDAKVTFTTSENITITNASTVNLSKSQGNIDVLFNTSEKGEHFILVQINAIRNNRTYLKSKRVNITAG